MSHRLAPVLAIALAAGLVAACASVTPPSPTRAPVSVPAVPRATPDTSPTPEPSPTEPPSAPDEGNVDDLPLGPILSVEAVGKRAIRVTLEDLDAKAWRVIVAGTGGRSNDRLELTVETGDVEPIVAVAEIRDGRVVGRMDLSAFGDPTAAAGGCHGSLGVCVDADGIVLPVDGNGRLGLELTSTGDTGLTVTGETAGWPGEPFILGPWTATDPFPWEPGVSF